MCWKDILVFADGSDNGLARARMATGLAAELDAAVDICIPRVVPTPFASSGTAFASHVIDEICEASEAAATRTLAMARAVRPDLKDRVRVQTPEVEASSLARFAASLGRKADVVIVGQPIAADASRDDDAILDGVLVRSGRPCISIPRWPEPRDWGRRILIAWKGVREAARAVHDALPLLQRADDVTIYTVGEGVEFDGDGTMGAASLSHHLRRHGVNSIKCKTAPAGNVGAAVLGECRMSGADMIVMGGYGHSEIRERAFGGATRTLLRSSSVPILMSH